MGLTCSILGHRYGEREHIEERDRQGSEEVIAIREVKMCERCGEELVVSESKEVVAVADPASEESEQQAIESHESTDTEPQDPIEHAEPVSPEPTTADEGIILDGDDDRTAGEWPPVEEAPDEETDEDTPWPAPETVETEDEPDREEPPGPWPDVEGEDEGFDAATVENDPDIGGQVIESVPDEPTEEVEETDAGFFRAGEIDSPDTPDEGNVHTEFFCPRCEWSARSLTSSVRRGDICPECRTGYIAEREVE